VRQAAVAAVAVATASLGLLAQPAAAQSPSDREIAKAGVFQGDDFPGGWRATPHKESKADLNDCPALKKAAGTLRKNKTADVSSDDFKRRDDQYGASVIVYRTEDVARRASGAAASNNLRRCVTRFVKDEVEKIAKEEGLDVKVEGGTVTGSGSYGYESSDIGLKVTVSKDSLSQDVFADFVFGRVGRALGVYFRVSTSEPSDFDTPTLDGLITSATERMTAATGGQTTTATAQPR
jgi:hypothetical protein